jgi:diguanylate cyclase (GGDEF)-like protein/PAS domain S-box-containing protein
VATAFLNSYKKKIISDLLIMAFFTIVIVLISVSINMHEKFIIFAEKYESLKVDEIITSGVSCLLLGFVWFTYRRLQDLIQTNMMIKNNENRYRSLIDSTDTSIYLVDRNCNYLYINEKHRKRIKANENKYIGQPFGAFHSQKETELFIEKAEKVFKTGKSMQFTYKSFRENRYYLQTFSPVMGNDNKPIAITVLNKDITKLKHMEEELRALSLKDDLTVLYNRRGFTTLAEQYLKMARRENRGFFVLYADLDNLKGINDKYGHHEGSNALIQIANILTDSLRESDIIARLGGDEFAVIQVSFDEDNVDIIISRIQEKIESYNALSNRDYNLSLSVGTSYFDPVHPCSLDQLLIKADEAMYEQKKNKRTSVDTFIPSFSKK